MFSFLAILFVSVVVWLMGYPGWALLTFLALGFVRLLFSPTFWAAVLGWIGGSWVGRNLFD